MSEFDQDKEYQKLHKRYQQQATENPPQALDQSILAAAHQAVDQTTEHQQAGIDIQPVKRNWYVPVSYVAILVVSLSVVMKLAFEPEIYLEESDMAVPQDLQPQISEVYESESATLSGATIASEQPANAAMKKSSASTASQMRAASPSVSAAQNDRLQKEAIIEERRSMLRSMPAAEAMMSEMAADESVSAPMEPPAQLSPRLAAKTGISAGQVAADSAASTRSELQIERGASEQKQSISAPVSRLFSTDKKQKKGLQVRHDQQQQANKLLQLFEAKKHKRLARELKRYRKAYPITQYAEILSQKILDWERQQEKAGAQQKPITEDVVQ